MSRPPCNCPHRDRVIAPDSWWFYLPTDPILGELQYVVGPITFAQAKQFESYLSGEPTDDFVLAVGANKGKPTLRVTQVQFMNHEWGCPVGLGLTHRWTPITTTDHVDWLLTTHKLAEQIKTILGK
jgi:hypothetical protein